VSSDDTPSVTIHVTAGNPTDEEIAAVTVAVLGLGTGGAPAPVHRAPAWARAARFEAVGQTPFVASNDPRLTHRSTGALPSAAT
jgi:hypothetical protein